ncbi:hypothetical protein BGZ47_009861 [Haplosporangium gracile]|nr:hypothetical protein BGZ47_009861 [Haplosporangium gracile]
MRLYCYPEGEVKAKSYINNLYPVEHKDMYPVLQEILERLLSMFEETLAEKEEFPNTRQKLLPEFEPEQHKSPPSCTYPRIRSTGAPKHVEGTANENIAATGIYYYHTEYTSESRLNFRIQVHEPDYEHCDDSGVLHMYDLKDEGPLVQPFDGVITKQDRCLVFPNIYQHQV